MTTQRANAIYDLNRADVIKMIDHAMTSRPKLKRPSVRSFKCVLAYIGHRDRIRPKDHNKQYCDDTLKQIADAIGDPSHRVAADVVAMATHLGILKTVKAGGKGTPAHRTIDLVKLAELVTVTTVGIDRDSNGGNRTKTSDSNGDHADSNGVSTVTPIATIDNQQSTAPVGAAVRVDVTNNDVLDADDLIDALMDLTNGN